MRKRLGIEARALLAAVERVSREGFGAALVTAMRFDEPAMEVERVHTSDPKAYPLGGRKRKRDTGWGRHVLTKRKVFVGEGAEAIAAAFDDHAVILGLGLRSAVNVPIVIAGRCLGTLNLLFREEHVAAARVDGAKLLALIAAPAFVSRVPGVDRLRVDEQA